MKTNKIFIIMLVSIFFSTQSMEKKIPKPPTPMMTIPNKPVSSPVAVEEEKPVSPYVAMINYLSPETDAQCKQKEKYNLCKMKKAAAKDIIQKLKKIALKLGKDKFTYKMAKNIIAQQGKKIEANMQKALTKGKQPIFVIKKFYKAQLSALKQWKEKIQETSNFKVKTLLVVHKKLANKLNKAIEEKMIDLGAKEISGEMIFVIVGEKLDEARNQKFYLEKKAPFPRLVARAQKLKEGGRVREAMGKIYVDIYRKIKKIDDWSELIETLKDWGEFADSLAIEEE